MTKKSVDAERMRSLDMENALDPHALFAAWLKDAEQTEPNDPNAMALATVDGDGLPNVRMVLLKGVDTHGFVFYTNYQSQKGQELLANMKAALCFHWKSLRRQIRLRGMIEKVSEEEADIYYHSRPELSQIGAWASQQSHPLANRPLLEQAVTEATARFTAARLAGKPIPRPPYWSGFRLIPQTMEFWKDRPFRLHDRIVFSRTDISEDAWEKTRLYP